MTTTRIDAPAGVPFIDMDREFDAPRELVYRAYVDPELLTQWLGPRKYHMTVESWDVRDGGTWRYVHSDDAGNAYGFHGVFHGPQTPDGMLQTFEFEGAPGHVSLDKLVFEDHGDRTVVRVHSVFQSIEARDAMIASGMADGVNDGYDRLDDLLARLAPVKAR
ncbi:MAG TPA: SRPBCC family protein [Candidatus Limnocylindrales bacterium]|jgi:uncharacterized protein YndB with AHSA1/START domain|nr:SRPBCC family protein [Candidatus Limnocylindrales bacterium]